MNWPTLPFDPTTTLFTTGLLYTLMPLTVWTILRGRHDPRSTGLWCVGAFLSGMSNVLFGLRPSMPDVALLEIAITVGYAGYAMRWSALRLERELAVPTALLFVLVVGAAALNAYFTGLGLVPRLLFNLSALALASTAIAHEAQRLARETDSRSARMVAFTYLLLTVALLLRLLSVLAGGSQPNPSTAIRLDIALVLATGMLSALWGNVGYLGVAMEHVQRLEGARRAELAAATARSEQAERQAAELKALSDERQELLRVISHEVRQPLHNAQAVLQSVETALRAEASGDGASSRIDRARAVLRQITAGLDNILAASTLLVGQRPAPLRDTDIDMLLELALGDLPPAGRPRVQIVRDTDVRTAAMDVGLMRLALRNLLNNALQYALPSSPVTLRVADSDDPLALIFDVADRGPGIAPELRGKLFERGTRGRHDVPGQGLGLYIVRLAMRRQHGRVDVRSSAEGTTFTLVVPQGLEPA